MLRRLLRGSTYFLSLLEPNLDLYSKSHTKCKAILVKVKRLLVAVLPLPGMPDDRLDGERYFVDYILVY